jgi:hypothetical protein
MAPLLRRSNFISPYSLEDLDLTDHNYDPAIV